MADDREIRRDVDALAIDEASQFGDPDWQDKLQRTAKDVPYQSINNVALALELAPEFVGRLRFDEFRARAVCRDLPWSKDKCWREWGDVDDCQLARWLQARNVPTNPKIVADAVTVVAQEHPMHEVRDYLEGLVWDGVPRLSKLFESYFGAHSDPGNDLDLPARDSVMAYYEATSRAFLIGAVARVFQPGCKLDTAPILEGKQGTYKSTGIAALMPRSDWFTDELAQMDTKDSAQDLQGKWIVELSELSSMKGKNIEQTKSFMSRSVDHYRPSYGRRSLDFPRQCAFVGTTNDQEYLKDESGNRRYWPIRCGEIQLRAIHRDRDQLWAEAVHAHKSGENWWLDQETESIARAMQSSREARDPLHRQVMELITDVCKHRVEVYVDPDEILEKIFMQPRDRDRRNKRRITSILKSEGWERFQRRFGATRRWVYRPRVTDVTECKDT